MTTKQSISLLGYHKLEYEAHTAVSFLRKLGQKRHLKRQKLAARGAAAEEAATTRSQVYIQRKLAEKRG